MEQRFIIDSIILEFTGYTQNHVCNYTGYTKELIELRLKDIRKPE